jgi:membrane protease YdiL (CAAX protease family)
LGGRRRLLSVLHVLTEKPWRLEAVARLLAGLFAGILAASLTLTALRFDAGSAKVAPLVFVVLIAGGLFASATIFFLIARPWTLENAGLRGAGLMVCAFAGVALTSVAQGDAGDAGPETSVLGMVIATVGFQGTALPLIWVLARQHGLTLREGFGLGLAPGRAVVLGATVAMLFLPVGLLLQSGISLLAHRFGIQLPEQTSVYILRLADSWPDRIGLAVVTMVLAPLGEEGLFRGIIYPAIRRLGFPNAALWVTSLVFAAIHFNALTFIPLFVLAVALAKLYERTGNLLASIACHATFNAFNFFMLYLIQKQELPLHS